MTSIPPATQGTSKTLEDLIQAHPNCVICRDSNLDEVPQDQITRLACDHIFHRECIGTWLRESSTCPTCRLQVNPIDLNLPEPALANGGQLGAAEIRELFNHITHPQIRPADIQSARHISRSNQVTQNQREAAGRYHRQIQARITQETALFMGRGLSEEIVAHIRQILPQLREIEQRTEGLFSGNPIISEGVSELLERLPELRDLYTNHSNYAINRLAADQTLVLRAAEQISQRSREDRASHMVLQGVSFMLLCKLYHDNLFSISAFQQANANSVLMAASALASGISLLALNVVLDQVIKYCCTKNTISINEQVSRNLELKNILLLVTVLMMAMGAIIQAGVSS